MHNINSEPIVNLLINVRPHSYRFLQQDIDHQYLAAYGNYLQSDNYRLIKNEIPDVRKIFKQRFEDAIKKTASKPGNPQTWREAKKVFYEIIDDFDDGIIDMISDLCHKNIRAITDCFQMILSNRVWCQEFRDYTEHPTVERAEYHFDIVNVIRTIACGENPVYMGEKEIQFNPGNLSNIQFRPSFDDSKVFIPNLIIDIKSKECDILPLVVIRYLNGIFSSGDRSKPQTEFITREDLINNLHLVFAGEVSEEKISYIIDYLFENRIIRKSIISKDSDKSINILEKDDYLYLTFKGSRLLSMLENDSVLLEIYREDVKRDYSDDKYYKSSLELISNNERKILFEDIIELARSIYYSEDYYQRKIKDNDGTIYFYDITFPITKSVITGIRKSLNRSQNINDSEKSMLYSKINVLESEILMRLKELHI